jgi:hypothetical protein
MVTGTDLEAVQAPGRRGPRRSNVADLGPGGTTPEGLEERLEVSPVALRDDRHRAVGVVPDPADQPEPPTCPSGVDAIADALDAPGDSGLQPSGLPIVQR